MKSSIVSCSWTKAVKMMRVHMAFHKLWITIKNCIGNTSFLDVGGWTYSSVPVCFFTSHLCAVGEQQSTSCTCKNKPIGIYKLKMEIQRNKYSRGRVRDHEWNMPWYTIKHCIQIVGTVDQPQKEQSIWLLTQCQQLLSFIDSRLWFQVQGRHPWHFPSAHSQPGHPKIAAPYSGLCNKPSSNSDNANIVYGFSFLNLKQQAKSSK